MIISKINKYAIGVILFIISTAAIFFFSRKIQTNPITGKKQHISRTYQEEIAMGLQCAPDVAAKFGGLDSDSETQNKIKRIGQKLVAVPQVSKSPYQFDFHVLADTQIVNAFSFPGGQVFITKGLYKLLKTDNQLAVILSHEIGHVIGRHTAEKLSGFNILEEFKDSSNVSEEYNPAQISDYISNILNVSFNNQEEVEADKLSDKFLVAAGYNPDSMPHLVNRHFK